MNPQRPVFLCRCSVMTIKIFAGSGPDYRCCVMISRKPRFNGYDMTALACRLIFPANLKISMSSRSCVIIVK